MRGDAYKKIFASDHGTVFQITVFEAGVGDWDCFLQYVRSKYVIAYSEDGVSESLANARTISERARGRSLKLEVLLPGFTVNCHFALRNQIELDVFAEEIKSQERADAIFQLMIGLAKSLNKPVFLLPELGSVTDEELRRMALCVANPGDDAVHCR